MKSVCLLVDELQHSASVFHSERAVHDEVLKMSEVEICVHVCVS